MINTVRGTETVLGSYGEGEERRRERVGVTTAEVQMVRLSLSSSRPADHYGIKYWVPKETYCSLAWHFHAEKLELKTLVGSNFCTLFSHSEFGERLNVLHGVPPSSSLSDVPACSRVPSTLPSTPWQVPEA